MKVSLPLGGQEVAKQQKETDVPFAIFECFRLSQYSKGEKKEGKGRERAKTKGKPQKRSFFPPLLLLASPVPSLGCGRVGSILRQFFISSWRDAASPVAHARENKAARDGRAFSHRPTSRRLSVNEGVQKQVESRPWALLANAFALSPLLPPRVAYLSFLRAASASLLEALLWLATVNF
jgi:hypothetical protein